MSCRVVSCLVLSCLVWSCIVLYCLTLSGVVWYCLVLCGPVLSCLSCRAFQEAQVPSASTEPINKQQTDDEDVGGEEGDDKGRNYDDCVSNGESLAEDVEGKNYDDRQHLDWWHSRLMTMSCVGLQLGNYASIRVPDGCMMEGGR